MRIKGNHNSVLVISDQHMPYNHSDMFKFLKAIKVKYKPDLVINIGDENDKHALSYHESDPNLMSAGNELKATRKGMKKLERIYPKQYICESNHGSLHLRKAMSNGIPIEYIKDYNEILNVGKGFKWSDEFTAKCGGRDVKFRHQFGANILRETEKAGMSVVQGHFHSKFEIAFHGNSDKLMFGMSVGCLLDHHSMAFAYNKLQVKRPILGVGLIIKGIPLLVPMLLNENSKWVGKL